MMPGGSIAPNIMFAAFGWLIVVIELTLTSVESPTFPPTESMKRSNAEDILQTDAGCEWLRNDWCPPLQEIVPTRTTVVVARNR